MNFGSRTPSKSSQPTFKSTSRRRNGMDAELGYLKSTFPKLFSDFRDLGDDEVVKALARFKHSARDARTYLEEILTERKVFPSKRRIHGEPPNCKRRKDEISTELSPSSKTSKDAKDNKEKKATILTPLPVLNEKARFQSLARPKSFESNSKISLERKRLKDKALAKPETDLICEFCKRRTSIARRSTVSHDKIDDQMEVVTLASLDASGIEGSDNLIFRLTEFRIYDQNQHMCLFDSLVDNNQSVYFDGVVKAIWDDNPDAEGGTEILCCRIIRWDMFGFDGAQGRVVISLHTPYAVYYLSDRPAKDYSRIYSSVMKQKEVTRTIVELLHVRPDCTFEEGLEAIRHTSISDLELTEEDLFANSRFLAQRIEQLDKLWTSDEDGPLMMNSSCAKKIFEFANLGGAYSKVCMKIMKANAKKQAKIHKPATTTPLVLRVFEDFFQHALSGSELLKKRANCGKCEACRQPNCGRCSNCLDMKEFGGPGIKKQKCSERPPCMQEIGDDGEDVDEEDDSKSKERASVATKSLEYKIHKVKSNDFTIERHSDGSIIAINIQTLERIDALRNPLKSEEAVEDMRSIRSGDVVSIDNGAKSGDGYLARIIRFSDLDDNIMVHVNFFIHGRDTVLGEAAAASELFVVDACGDVPVSNIVQKIQVDHLVLDLNTWRNSGGCKSEPASTRYYFQKFYEHVTGRFVSIPKDWDDPKTCAVCRRKEIQLQLGMPAVLPESFMEMKDRKEFFSKFQKDGFIFSLHDAVYLLPRTHKFKHARKKFVKVKEEDVNIEYDEELYPERWCKKSEEEERFIESPFQIGRITRISRKINGYRKFLEI